MNFSSNHLTICEDTRNKPGKHNAKNEYFRQNGIEVLRLPLPVGDYVLMNDAIAAMLQSTPDVAKKDFLGLHTRSVDTKFSLSEVYSCVIQDHARFAREADRAVENGIELIILVEEHGVKSIDDVQYWRNPHYAFSMRRYQRAMWLKKNNKWSGKRIAPPVTSKGLMDKMKTFAEHHNCTWEFCEPEEAGAKVVEILTRGL